MYETTITTLYSRTIHDGVTNKIPNSKRTQQAYFDPLNAIRKFLFVPFLDRMELFGLIAYN